MASFSINFKQEHGWLLTLACYVDYVHKINVYVHFCFPLKYYLSLMVNCFRYCDEQRKPRKSLIADAFEYRATIS